MNHENVEPAVNQGRDNEQPNPKEPRMADPIELVNQQIEQRSTLGPEAVDQPGMTPQMLDEGDNLRGDLRRDE